MNPASGLTYCDDLCSAFMAAIVRSFEQHHPNRYLGRTAMQKLVYFCKVLGAPVPCSFEIHTYGPYSDTVTFAMDSLLADDVLVDRSGNPKYSSYGLGPNADEILGAYGEAIQPHQDKIDAVVANLGNFEPLELELIATLHFIHHRLKQIQRRDPAEAEVVQEFRRVKRDKFSRGEIDAFYAALRRARLVSG